MPEEQAQYEIDPESPELDARMGPMAAWRGCSVNHDGAYASVSFDMPDHSILRFRITAAHALDLAETLTESILLRRIKPMTPGLSNDQRMELIYFLRGFGTNSQSANSSFWLVPGFLIGRAA